MKISTVLFDLDGTLLPMDNDEFTKGYFKLLVKKLAPYGYEQQELVGAIWKGTAAMVKNNGSQSNYDVFWKAFADMLGERVYETKSVFDDFYENEFNEAKALCGLNSKAAEAVKCLKEQGYRVALTAFIETKEQKAEDTTKFVNIVRKYEHITELTPEIMHELIDHIEVHAPEKSSGRRQQKVDIFFRFKAAAASAVISRKDYKNKRQAA